MLVGGLVPFLNGLIHTRSLFVFFAFFMHLVFLSIIPLIVILPATFIAVPDIVRSFPANFNLPSDIMERAFNIINLSEEECQLAFGCYAGYQMSLKFPEVRKVVQKLVQNEENFYKTCSPPISRFYSCFVNREHPSNNCSKIVYLESLMSKFSGVEYTMFRRLS